MLEDNEKSYQSMLPEDTNAVILRNEVLDDFEASFNFHSLRKSIEIKKEQYLKDGSWDDANDPDDFHVQDPYLRTVLNEDLEVKIGNSIFKYLNNYKMVEIKNGHVGTLVSIRTNPSSLVSSRHVVYHDIGSAAIPMQPCTFDFTYSLWYTGINQVVVDFTNTSNLQGGTVGSFTWTFGDGNSSTDENPSHTYNSQGTMVVTLTYSNPNAGWSCKTGTVTKTINLNSCNANFNWNANDLSVTFSNASTSQFNITSYNWNFGDGSTTSSLQNPSHSYQSSGFYTVTLTTTDNQGCSSSYSTSFSITNSSGSGSSDCCDKNDRDKNYVMPYDDGNRKFKYKIWQTNVPFYHRWGAATVNYKKNSKGNWKEEKADEIGAWVQGTVYYRLKKEDSECSSSFQTNMGKSGSNNNDVHYNYPFGQVFWTHQHSLVSDHWVKFNGKYIHNIVLIYITNDCK